MQQRGRQHQSRSCCNHLQSDGQGQGSSPASLVQGKRVLESSPEQLGVKGPLKKDSFYQVSEMFCADGLEHRLFF